MHMKLRLAQFIRASEVWAEYQVFYEVLLRKQDGPLPGTDMEQMVGLSKYVLSFSLSAYKI